MGPKGSKEKKSYVDKAHDKTAILLCDAFKHTDLDFNDKEVTTLKIRMKDAENYFLTTFDFLLYFNSMIFDAKLSVLYENFNQAVEKWTKTNSPLFTILIDFDDESETIELNNKIEVDSLFTIIFEPLEIKTMLYFFLTNCDRRYIELLFQQLYENFYTHKTSRKFNSMYFLLPNTDFFIRNQTNVMYLVNQSNFEDSLNVLNNNTFEYRNEYTDALFLSLYFNQLITMSSTLNEGYDILMNFIMKNTPGFIRSVFMFDLLIDMNDFILNNEKEFEILDLIASKSLVNVIQVLMNKNSDGRTVGNSYKQIKQEQAISHRQMNMINQGYYSNRGVPGGNMMNLMSNRNAYSSAQNDLWAMSSIDDNFKQNLEILLKKIIHSQEKSSNEKNVISIRFLCKYSKNKPFPKNKTISPLIAKANELLTSLINDSFSYSTKERTRKIVIEFYQLDITNPVSIDKKNKNGQRKNNDSISGLTGHIKQDSNENLYMKTSQYYHYVYEKVYFCWFLTKKHITKMKEKIKVILYNKIDNNKSIKTIYDFLFTKSYYLTSMERVEDDLSLYDIEHRFYC